MARVTLLSPPWRLVTATLVALSWLTLPTYVLAIVLLPPVPPLVMVRSFAVGTALPALVAWAIARAFTGSAGVRDGMLRLERSDLAIEVSCAAIAAVRPWWIPLPRPGLGFALRSDGRVPLGIALDDPGPLLAALADGGMDTNPARRHPSMVYAATRRARRWYAPLVKFVVLGMLPASVLFYTHQHIAYGGTFGQYYLESLGAWLATLLAYWATTVVLLVSYASIWRAAAEVVVWAAAAIAPSHAQATRRIAGAVCAIGYYGGVPFLLALRYLAE